jgi:small-conductance mechanosensitive channel
LILNSIGIKISALVTGSAALLVGVGLGLQQTFTDFISGIILLFEGKTKIGDILQIDNEVLRLENIGLRTTECLNRDGIVVFIPNSKIVTDKVINLTHKAKSIRFNINIGVSYDSDVSLVTQVLEESAKQHPHVKRTENIEVRMIDFGESSLLFQLLFFSEEIFRIESVKSDIRKIINQKFIENNIKIPYPQVDIHLDEHGRKIEK